MALVKALKDVYLGSLGYHKKDEEFEYVGPKNSNLQPVKVKVQPETEPGETK